MKIINKRRCIATNISKSKEELIRISLDKNGKFEIGSKTGGRGAYISKDSNIIDNLYNKRLLNKAFRTSVPRKVYDDLAKKIRGE